MSCGDLDSPSEDDFEFIPYVGFRYKRDGSSIISSMLSKTKPGVFFSDKNLHNLAQIMQSYFDAIEGITTQQYQLEKFFTEKDFIGFKNKYVYKFTTEETWERYIQKGSFLFSSLERFRCMEQQGNPAGDRFEGKCFSAHRVGEIDLISATISGFNALIYSTTSTLDNLEFMRDRFGSVVLQIELLPFTKNVCSLLNQSNLDIIEVQYADLKVYRSNMQEDVLDGFPPNLTAKMHATLRDAVRLPSIFSKPSRFEPEKEVRIAISFEKDAPDMMPVTDEKLLAYVKRIY